MEGLYEQVVSVSSSGGVYVIIRWCPCHHPVVSVSSLSHLGKKSLVGEGCEGSMTVRARFVNLWHDDNLYVGIIFMVKVSSVETCVRSEVQYENQHMRRQNHGLMI